MFSHAIVRPPCPRFAEGLTTASLGAPHLALALEQHARYCEALERCGLRVTRLEPDDRFPDSTFVEDTAVLTARGAVLARPGAPSRAGEAAAMAPVLRERFATLEEIRAPGTLDGGDVCQAGDRFFIGLSARTNEEGARQLSDCLARWGYGAVTVDVEGMGGLLHLKSGMAHLGGGRIAAVGALASHPAFEGYEIVPVPDEEAYAANCVRLNERVLIPAGFPETARRLEGSGFSTLTVDVSEFRKMDGGLSCLSLRF